MVIKFISF